MAAMVKQYGKQKGKEVFYASKNKGTIEGVEETKMSYINRVNELLNERNIANKAKKDAYVRSRGGRDNAPQGVYSDQEVYADNPHGSEGSERGIKTKGVKPSKDQISTHRLGLKRSLKSKHSTPSREDSHTVYKHMGILMAEALGHRVDEVAPLIAAGARLAGGAAKKAAKKAGNVATKVLTLKDPKNDANIAVRGGKVTEEETEPTEKDLKKANRDVHTKKTVKGETPEETKDFDKSVDDAMGKKRVGAEGGIEGLKAKIRAAGERSRR